MLITVADRNSVEPNYNHESRGVSLVQERLVERSRHERYNRSAKALSQN